MDTLQQQLIAKFQLPNTQTKTLLQRTAMEYAERINKPILNRDQLMHQYRHAAVNVAKWEISKEYREAVRSEAEKNTEKL